MKPERLFSFVYRFIITFIVIYVIYILVKKDYIFGPLTLVYVAFSLSFVWLTTILWFIADKSNPYKKLPDWMEPFTSVVPVKNERVEKLEQVLNAIIRSEGKKQILVGSDGSSNEHIEDYKKLILKLRKEGNDIMLGVFPSKGKNKIQSKLHTLAKYEIIVNVDSDVMVWNKTFVRLLAPFHDKRVGITNSKIDIVPSKKILDKYYRVLYLCANQSGRKTMGRFGLMPSASGEILAYRKEILDTNLTKYESPSFLWGVPITFGEDRLLTNIALSLGYKAVYCEDSVGWTWGKNSFVGLIKQQLRWRRSWIRETIRALSFSWRKPLLFINVFFSLVLPIIFSILIFTLTIRIILYQWLLGLLALPIIAIVTTLIKDTPLLFEDKGLIHKLAIFAIFNLYFITPLWLYAAITVDQTDWGSRDTSKSSDV